MEKEFIPFAEALALKELGFNGVCLANYNNLLEITRLILGKTDVGSITWNKTPDKYNNIVTSNERILAPLYQQAFRWFREKYDLHQHLQPIFSSNEWEYVILDINWGDDKEVHYNCRKGEFSTEEEAELACLIKLIELAKTITNGSTT